MRKKKIFSNENDCTSILRATHWTRGTSFGNVVGMNKGTFKDATMIKDCLMAQEVRIDLDQFGDAIAMALLLRCDEEVKRR